MNYGLTEQAIRKLACSIKENKDKHYTHNQTVASSQWVITHDLNKYPSVEVVDTAGTIVIGDITHNSVNQITITFNAAFSGKAFLN